MLKLTTLSSSSKGNCHILECDNSSIMIDCGINYRDIVNNIDVTKLRSVFITHRHQDHCKGAKELSACTNCEYYMNEETAENVELYGEYRYKKTIHHRDVIDLEDFKVICFDVYHDVQNTNFLILHKESGIKILYITDTSNVSNIHFKDVDFFIIEGNFSKKWDLEGAKYKRTNSEYGHLPIEDTVEFLLENVNVNTKGIFISHISHSFKKIEEFESIVRNEMPINLRVCALNNQIIGKQTFILKEDIEIDFI